MKKIMALLSLLIAHQVFALYPPKILSGGIEVIIEDLIKKKNIAEPNSWSRLKLKHDIARWQIQLIRTLSSEFEKIPNIITAIQQANDQTTQIALTERSKVELFKNYFVLYEELYKLANLYAIERKTKEYITHHKTQRLQHQQTEPNANQQERVIREEEEEEDLSIETAIRHTEEKIKYHKEQKSEIAKKLEAQLYTTSLQVKQAKKRIKDLTSKITSLQINLAKAKIEYHAQKEDIPNITSEEKLNQRYYIAAWQIELTHQLKEKLRQNPAMSDPIRHKLYAELTKLTKIISIYSITKATHDYMKGTIEPIIKKLYNQIIPSNFAQNIWPLLSRSQRKRLSSILSIRLHKIQRRPRRESLTVQRRRKKRKIRLKRMFQSRQ